MANIINAIVNLVSNASVDLEENFLGNNRANNAGDALENYIKDLFANTFNCSEVERLEKFNEVFSWLGNKTNPPDCMLRNGDAIEIKKIEKISSSLALNSSYPKQKLISSSHMILEACRKAENWKEKDLLYIVGCVSDKCLKSLCMVYGEDFCANHNVYERVKSTIKEGIEKISDIELAETNELGKLNKVDPLGITYLRIRGMWGIENPWKVFNYIYSQDSKKSFNFMCLINKNKWEKLTNMEDLFALREHGLQIEDVKIKNPDNPSQLKEAKMIIFSK